MNKHRLNKIETQPRVYLKEWRMVHGLNQTELANKMNVSKSEISRLEGGNRKVSVGWLENYSKALGIERDQLMTPPGVTVMRRAEVMSVAEGEPKEPPQRNTPAGSGPFGITVPHPYILVNASETEHLLIDTTMGRIVARLMISN